MKLPDFFQKFSSSIPWIQTNTAYVVRHGSRAYGTHTPKSDEDFKGITIPTKEYYFGCQKNFEQAELKDPDAVIYEIRKFFKLAAECNPNCLEVLFVDEEDLLYQNDIGAEIRKNRRKFLSKRVKHTFAGYAYSQLKRIKLHRNYVLNPPKVCPSREQYGLPNETLIPADQLTAAEAEIQKEIDRIHFLDAEGLSEAQKIELRANISGLLASLKLNADDQWNAAARKVGVDENFIQVMQKERQYKGAKKEWDNYHTWKKNRNRERYEMEEKFGYDLKHAYHLKRLTDCCRELLETGELLVRRPNAAELLEIRKGAWTYDDLIDFAEKSEKELDQLYLTSTALPKMPNLKELDNLCISLVEQSLNG